MRYCLLVESAPVAGRDAEYNDWYNMQHLSDLLKIPGVVSARRFKLAGPNLRPASGLSPYLAIYEIETDNLQGVFDEIGKRRGTSAMVMSEAIDMNSIATAAYEMTYDTAAKH